MGKNSKFTIEDFLARSAAGKSSLEAYEYHLSQLQTWLGKPLAQATERDLVNLKKRLRDMRAGPHYCNLLRMFYKAADREDLRQICVLKQRLRKFSPQEVLTVGDVQRMIESAPSLRDRALIGVLWETGARIHEVLALDIEDIREKTENGSRKLFVLWFKKAKISGEEHTSYVIEAAPVLSAWLKAHPHRVPDAPLFPSATGDRLDRHHGFRIVARVGRRAGIEKRVYPHLFRHSRATHLLRLGMSEIQVKKLLGWAPSSTMLSRYAHLVDQDAYRALMKAQGYEVPEAVDLGKLALEEEKLQPVVPMSLPPAATLRIPAAELDELLSDPKVVRFLQLLQGVREAETKAIST